jgi:uncharacterized protein
VMYNEGRGVPVDYAEAVKWSRKAADQGNATGQYALGFMYANGRGVPRDYVQAHKWWTIAASANEEESRDARDNAIHGLADVAARMTPEQIAEAQKLAREWKPKKEESGRVGAH